MKKICIIFMVGSIYGTACRLEAQENISLLSLNLEKIEQEALAYSPRYMAARADEELFDYRSRQYKTRNLPKLSIDGYYRYNKVVPEIAVNPALLATKLGDNTNYSLGPTIIWNIWNQKANPYAYLSIRLQYEAKKKERELIERQILLALRAVYAQLLLAADHAVLIADALNLAQSQYKDILVNVQAGAKSKLDKLSSHQEVLKRKKELRQAREHMAQYLYQLFVIIGRKDIPDVSNPYTADKSLPLSDNITPATALISLDGIQLLLDRFEAYAGSAFSFQQPGLALYDDLIQSARYAIQQSYAGFMPEIQLFARSSFDYPNGPKPERFNQHSMGASLSWPLFEFNQSVNEVREQKSAEQSVEKKKDEAAAGLKGEWNAAQARLLNLREQKYLSEQTVIETEELAAIVYQSYRNGSATYIEVENANYKALGAKMELALIKAQMFTSLAVLASLSEKE